MPAAITGKILAPLALGTRGSISAMAYPKTPTPHISGPSIILEKTLSAQRRYRVAVAGRAVAGGPKAPGHGLVAPCARTVIFFFKTVDAEAYSVNTTFFFERKSIQLLTHRRRVKKEEKKTRRVLRHHSSVNLLIV